MKVVVWEWYQVVNGSKDSNGGSESESENAGGDGGKME